MLPFLGVIYLNTDQNSIFNDKMHEFKDSYLKTKVSNGTKEIVFPFTTKLLPSNKLFLLKFCNSKGKLKI